MAQRPRYWTEWETFSKATDKALVVWTPNRLRNAARSRDTAKGTYWPSEGLYYYLKGVRYYVSIWWYQINVCNSENLTVHVPVEDIPANVMRVAKRVQSVLAEKITQADHDKLAEQRAFEAKVLAWMETPHE